MPIIQVDNVSMRFNLAQEKTETLKEYTVSLPSPMPVSMPRSTASLTTASRTPTCTSTPRRALCPRTGRARA